jgi:hypothetical protein
MDVYFYKHMKPGNKHKIVSVTNMGSCQYEWWHSL